MGKWDLLLINPGAREQVYGKLGESFSGIEPPLFIGLIASYIKQYGFSVKIFDADAENWSPEYTAKKIAEYNPLLTAIVVLGTNPSASSTPKMTAVNELLNALKKNNIETKTILLGLHPSALPERTLNEEKTDFVGQGEGFQTVLQLLETLSSGEQLSGRSIPGLWYRQNGKIVSNPPTSLMNPDELPIAAWDLMPMDKYRAHNWHCFENINERKPYGVIYTSLGCPFSCTYCNIKALYNGKAGIRFRSPEKVVEEIDLLVRKYKIKNIKFIDELFALKEEQVERICDLIIRNGYDLNIWAYARVDTITKPMLKKMKRAGINWLAYGFESANEKVRQGVAKTTDQGTVKKAVDMTRAAGIYIMGNFIFGLPDDTQETMRETLDMAKEYNFEYVNFYTTMAYPGSQLYQDALTQGVKLPEVWHGYAQLSEETLPLATKYLSAAEVLRFRDNAFMEYFRNPDYLDMIRRQFGTMVVEHIEEMLKNDIQRKFA
ncbi:B12-binding domain-containing radical SAM protein [Chloroflexota bacterium]